MVWTLTGELHHSVQELSTKIKLAKKVGEMKACKKGLSQESLQLPASILNISTTDIYEILQEGDDEVSYFKDFSKKRREWEGADCIPPQGKGFADKDWNFIVQDTAQKLRRI